MGFFFGTICFLVIEGAGFVGIELNKGRKNSL